MLSIWRQDPLLSLLVGVTSLICVGLWQMHEKEHIVIAHSVNYAQFDSSPLEAQPQVTMVDMVAACDGDESCMATATPVLEFRRVAIVNHTLVFLNHNVQRDVNELERNAFKYVVDTGLEGKIPQVIKFKADSRSWGEAINGYCDEVISDTALIDAPSWAQKDTFHLLNDELLPHFWHLRRLGAHRVSTLLQLSPPAQNDLLPLYVDTIAIMFPNKRNLNVGGVGVVCLEHVVWGPGPKPFSRIPADPSPYWMDMTAKFSNYMRRLYRAPVEWLAVPERHRIVLFRREKQMNDAEAALFAAQLDRRGFEVIVVPPREFKYFHDHQSMLSIMYGASCVVGVHGSDMSYALFAPPGALLYELRTHQAYNEDTLNRIAHDAGLRYYSVDFRNQLAVASSAPKFPLEKRERLCDWIELTLDAQQIAPDEGMAGSFSNPIIL